MKVALYTITYQGLWYAGPFITIEEMIPRIARLGYDGISLSGKRHHASALDLDTKRCAHIIELANSNGLELVALDTYTDFMDPRTEVREAQLVNLRELIKLTGNLGIKVVKIFPGWSGTTMRNGTGAYDNLWRLLLPYASDVDRWDWIRSAVEEALRWAEEFDVVLALQNHGPPFRPGYEDALAMTREINHDRLRMCLDIGLGCFDPVDQQSDDYIAKAVSDCHKYIVYSHFNGRFAQDRHGRFRQEPYDAPGITKPSGALINYPAFVNELKGIDFQGYLAYEVCSPVIEDHEYKGLGEVDNLVRNALGYMRQLLQ